MNIISLGRTAGLLMSIIGGVELKTRHFPDNFFGLALLLIGLYTFYIFDFAKVRKMKCSYCGEEMKDYKFQALTTEGCKYGCEKCFIEKRTRTKPKERRGQ